jgi:hypothetical protein|tara:strand:- start:85 stop:330 length:246 start_codon:yes stop_codon:yes gene_type:complete
MATLNKKEIKKLAKLGKGILASLSCDVNGMGIPCRTDRFYAVELMEKYLKIHYEKPNICTIFKTKSKLKKKSKKKEVRNGK